jgi:hypothetical protein
MVILPDGVPCNSEYTLTTLISNTKKSCLLSLSEKYNNNNNYYYYY